ncbi:MAG: Amino acid transporter ATP-binding protein [Bacteroidota bacterium]|nr:Amino acid transporter ATP-binding protein [Bacteroidota bacterium]
MAAASTYVENLINIKGLHKFYHGNHILKGIDFSANTGDLISVIGRSGCGKTTFLRCMNCLEILDSGTIHIAGITLNRKAPAKISDGESFKKRRTKRMRPMIPFLASAKEDLLDEDFKLKAQALRLRVGMLFQSLNLFPHLTVLDNVMKPPIIVKKDTKDQATLRAIQILEKVGMDKFMDRYPYQLSGGQAQRVAIARALAMSPQVMLYDEPTSALDPELTQEVLQVMLNLHREGMTQIVVTHEINFARKLSDYIVYMDEGQIIEVGTPEQLFNNPKDERTWQYLNIL